ncbi:saccharopine dehydrogenase NADP-binding domain-containing protein [Haladaptatus sp. F3-133]|jgi:short subunit dehydrogenase-like uncharacterized protein|uniref:Saccharopine dehydrogenase NADP-binding domain-containing protein n=1 Tax=Halorutilus salinus TaxID=2487751 RepID=A0A9Q4C3C0_9EURY|nr:saccharopine dehydrogenase NADP-binding domain-containing protein [Halorutilus salinus]MCX2819105.1 saccharopine dehydrogenase NADP-binding domain-containing protein [Halorutilus salinus]
MSDESRRYDLVVWGATGFAGRLVAKYLTERYAPDDVSVAIGGRDRDRLEEFGDELTDRGDGWDAIPVVVGDATEPDTLRGIAKETDVVCTTVGPYTRYGTPMVDACVEVGTDYCDLTGEVNWIREMVDLYHDDAVDSGARIVHSCGFDSVPADLGTLMVQSFATEEYATACDSVRVYLEESSGGASGGTLASAAELFKAASEDPTARRTVRNPYSLAPPGERDGPDPGEQTGAKKDTIRSVWTAPSPMAVVNERVIRRTNALLEYPWGREFRCTEVVPTGTGVRGAVTATAIAGGLGAGKFAMSLDPIRSGLQRFVFPDPGEGPTRDEIENGYFTVRVLGRGRTDGGKFTVEAVIGGDLDPGYGSTARMLGEAAMSLVKGDVESPLSGGVLTPASGIGQPLGDRISDAGMTVEVRGRGEPV